MSDLSEREGSADHDAQQELGAPRHALFDGVLDGRGGDQVLIRAQVDRINDGGYCQLSADVDGASFSLLADDTPIPGEHMGRRANFVVNLQALVDSLPPDARLECTLRSTEVFEHGVRETLYGVEGGFVRAVERVRSVAPGDAMPEPAKPGGFAPPNMGRGRLVAIGALLVVLFGLIAWRSGYVDRFLAASAESLEIQYGDFDGMVVAEVGKAWGRYEITLRRGPEYPKDKDTLDRLLAAADSAPKRAAINAVSDGDDLWVRLQTREGKVIEARQIELSALLGSADAEAKTKCPGRIGGAVLRLAVDSGRKRD